MLQALSRLMACTSYSEVSLLIAVAIFAHHLITSPKHLKHSHKQTYCFIKYVDVLALPATKVKLYSACMCKVRVATLL
jgi:hypothetical protein